MRKRSKYIVVGLILFIVLSIIITNKIIEHNSLPEISYIEEKSGLGHFSIEKDYVMIVDQIVVRNNTNKDLNFFMYADVTEDRGLVAEDFAPACKKDSLEKEKYFIKANSEATFGSYFKAKKEIKKQNMIEILQMM